MGFLKFAYMKTPTLIGIYALFAMPFTRLLLTDDGIGKRLNFRRNREIILCRKFRFVFSGTSAQDVAAARVFLLWILASLDCLWRLSAQFAA